jgi:hypothetical protein
MARQDTTLQAVVDDSIVQYEAGRIAEAQARLRQYQLPEDLIHRVLYRPDHRRSYINDFLTGN